MPLEELDGSKICIILSFYKSRYRIKVKFYHNFNANLAAFLYIIQYNTSFSF